MKVAIPIILREPIEESKISGHFGRAKYYAILDTSESKVEIIPNQSRHMGGNTSPPDYIASFGVDGVIAEKMGKPAYEKLTKRGIKIYTPTAHVETIKELWHDFSKVSEVEDPQSFASGCDCDHNHDHH